MPIPYSADTMTLGTADPAEADRLNDVLQAHDLGRPLGKAGRTAGARLVVPVTDADPAAILRTLQAVGSAERVRLDPLLHNGTFRLSGADAGRAFPWAELSNVDDRALPPWQPLPAGLRRPVVALLDTGVRPHPWLPDTPAGDPFLVHADDPALAEPWHSPVAEGPAVKPGEVPQAGHATFLAGLIRMAAPSARILSVRVMADDGTVRESTAVSALHWLFKHHNGGNPLDVVCLAFGRRPGDQTDQTVLDEMKRPLGLLADAGVQLVASAGNEHQEGPVYPGAYEMVTAVGAGFGEYHAEFSNFGPWIGRYRDGVGVLSIMPPDRWARWSGTSFAAAVFAGDLARPQIA
jgi:hypothetical protein